MEGASIPAKDQQSGASQDNGDSNPAVSKDGKQDGSTISKRAQKLIATILDQMNELSDVEKYLLYLKLFQVSNVLDPLRQPLNPLGSRSEINRTISWIKTHLEEDPDTSLPKQQVYDEYTSYCSDNQIKPLSQADFGKVMKQVYPKVRARRLGTRGNSRYCYSGLRRCLKLKPPKLPDLADKPLGTEAPCTESSLTAAAWLIVKEWSEVHFGQQFSSLQALAKFLVRDRSIGRGTDAANQIAMATESQLKGDSNRTATKHREMQLQLQKKIQQKNENKERKRKNQSPKNEARCTSSTNKRARGRSDTSPLTGADSGTSSTSTSPTQGKPICDKSVDFSGGNNGKQQQQQQQLHLAALPDFKSFQQQAPKVAIPRLNAAAPAAAAVGRGPKQSLSQPQPQPPQVKNAKYKAIQPKPPQSCDIVSYNPHHQGAAACAGGADIIRSQGVAPSPQSQEDRFKECRVKGGGGGGGEDADEDGDDAQEVFPLPRERLNSIGNVDKDAMDEYLGTNNSQHEEELSKYFDNPDPPEQDQKLSQLRQLLEQNGVTTIATSVNNNNNNSSSNHTPILEPPCTLIPYAVPTSHVGGARRRVSFETPHDDASSTVPPSPNTRRKNFSFTPISPGPQSPGHHSKSSSANGSPFVSPRNTPVPRSRNNNARNMMTCRKAVNNIFINNNNVNLLNIKKEPDAGIELPQTNQILQKLLISNSKVPYTPDYASSTSSSSIKNDVLTANILPTTNGIKEQMFITSTNENVAAAVAIEAAAKSRSLNQMIKSFPDGTFNIQTHTNNNNNNNDFNDFDTIPDSETVAVKHIIESLGEQQDSAANLDLFPIGMPTNPLPGFELIATNPIHQTDYEPSSYTPSLRTLGRSQSMDVNGCFEVKGNGPPSRSVPTTPLSFDSMKSKIAFGSSRSYPNTPLLSESPFTYSTNGDCLLNGQPIRTGGSQSQLSYLMTTAGADDIAGDDDMSPHHIVEFNMTEGDATALMDENGVLIGDHGFHN